MIAMPRRERGPEVAGAAHRIHLEQVVGAHAPADQPAEQRLEHGGVVVHAAEQHRLVHHREAGVGERGTHARSACGVSSFGWLKCVITQRGW